MKQRRKSLLEQTMERLKPDVLYSKYSVTFQGAGKTSVFDELVKRGILILACKLTDEYLLSGHCN